MVDATYVSGVTFESFRDALVMIHYYKGRITSAEDGYNFPDMTDEEFETAKKHVIPMQHNYENPIVAEKGDAHDTWIEYWIDDDDKQTQDSIKKQKFIDDPLNPTIVTVADTSHVYKVARVTLRFIGKHAEMWAKLMHHLTERKSVGTILREYCRAQVFEQPGPIRPMNIDYFGVQNTAIAYDIEFSLKYEEMIRLPAQPLQFIGMAEGTIQ